MISFLAAIRPALPELFLALAALVLLVGGVLVQGTRDGGGKRLTGLAVAALLVAFLLMLGMPSDRVITFSGLFVMDGFAAYAKTLILIGAGFALILSVRYNQREGIDRFEYPVLVLFAVCGMMAMVSANDLLSLYIGLELQSLALYVLAAFKRDTVRSTEAGLKYFVLGALSSGMLLFGASLLYGFTGTTNFEGIAGVLGQGGDGVAIGALVGIVFLSVGIAFKCSAVPFHMWTPDVYEGAPTSVTAFFSVAPKVAALALFIRVLTGPLGGLVHEWQQIVWFLSAASMILGGYAAISQTNIKRLMAYSSIGHVGYALMGLAAGTPDGVRGVLIYLGIYLFMNVGCFSIILSMGRNGQMLENISDFAGLARSRPGTAFALALFMLSMAGIPPLAGIFAKVVVFLPALHAGLYTLAIIGALTSVLACFYYLRLVKVMYFDEPAEALDPTIPGGGERFAMIVSAVVVLFFCLVPGKFIAIASAAAATLFR
jgi:NADH-quinone oxidoreductase subunit N